MSTKVKIISTSKGKAIVEVEPFTAQGMVIGGSLALNIEGGDIDLTLVSATKKRAMFNLSTESLSIQNLRREPGSYFVFGGRS